MPGRAQMTVKLCFRKGDGLVLGAQVVARGQGVDSRSADKDTHAITGLMPFGRLPLLCGSINAFAMAIQARMTVFDLEQAELAYAPPFSSPKVRGVGTVVV